MQHIFSNKEDLIHSLGTFIADCSAKAIQECGRFTIAFSGGSAATMVCDSMSIEKCSGSVDWSKWNILFCDERFVDLTHPDSNYKAIHDGLIAKHPEIKNVIALNKSGSVAEAAKNYELEMQNLFGKVEFPCIDLIILGMGPDGHICSLFPNHALLGEQKRWVGWLENSPKPPPQRITFTLNVVNNAKEIIFITTGAAKAENIKKAIEDGPSDEVPASLVKPVNGNLHWFMNTDAASMLSQL